MVQDFWTINSMCDVKTIQGWNSWKRCQRSERDRRLIRAYTCAFGTHWIYMYIPIPSMYGIFTYIWLISMVNVGKYTILFGFSFRFLLLHSTKSDSELKDLPMFKEIQFWGKAQQLTADSRRSSCFSRWNLTLSRAFFSSTNIHGRKLPWNN